MQPYFLPYIGYWQLMHNVDVFVVYDDIQYAKKGWINRNRFLLNGQPERFTLPLKKDSDFCDISARELSDTFSTENMKLMRRLEAAYRSAPNFQEGKSLLSDILSSDEKNLFWFIYQSIEEIHTRLKMSSRLVVSSTLGISHKLRGQDRVIATCKALNATDYVNPIGGIELYDRSTFMAEGVRLHFQKVKDYEYHQFQNTFVPHLSVIDTIMFIGLERARALLTEMELC